jgi:hypothetical protein
LKFELGFIYFIALRVWEHAAFLAADFLFKKKLPKSEIEQKQNFWGYYTIRGATHVKTFSKIFFWK